MVKPTPEADLDDTVSLRAAFVVMQQFLREHWERSGRPADSLAELLSSGSLLQDGGTADPAVLHDWLRVAESVRRGHLSAIALHLDEPE